MHVCSLSLVCSFTVEEKPDQVIVAGLKQSQSCSRQDVSVLVQKSARTVFHLPVTVKPDRSPRDYNNNIMKPLCSSIVSGLKGQHLRLAFPAKCTRVKLRETFSLDPTKYGDFFFFMTWLSFATKDLSLARGKVHCSSKTDRSPRGLENTKSCENTCGEEVYD